MSAKTKTAPKTTTKATAKKATRVVRSRNAATKTATTKKVASRAKAAPKAAPKTTWVRQSTVEPEAGMAVSRFTTQSQRRLLRGLASGTQPTSSPATGRSIDRLASLGLVLRTKAGKVALTAAGKTFVKENPAPKAR